MILDDKSVTQAVFHPRPEEYEYSPMGLPTLTPSDGAEIAGYLHECQSSDTLLIFFHGNGEIAADYDSFVSIYTDLGVSCWIIDYRGYGRSTGTPSFLAMFTDADAILADVPRLGAAINRKFGQIIVMGRSLGSASAIHLASTHPSSLAGLVLDSAYADGLALITRLGAPGISRKDAPNFKDNIDKIRQCQLPTLIIHGTDDWIIPITDARALFKDCPSESKRMLEVRGAGHNDLLLVGFSEYCRELKDYFVRLNV
ncbi:MAG: lysophospholipase [Desulfobacteraceae bacterium]|nr:lysophospholipase [Desulfobacteraceae bacterium]